MTFQLSIIKRLYPVHNYMQPHQLLCTVMCNFITGSLTYQLMPIFWKIVSVLEVSLDLKVVAAVNDGAPPGQPSNTKCHLQDT